MDHIDKHLATAALSGDYPKAIKAALDIGKKTLNRYYNKTDHSEVFRIAMSTFLMFVTINGHLIFILFSSTSSTQARVLQKSWMGGGLGNEGTGNCSVLGPR
jgi:hypothetical protein